MQEQILREHRLLLRRLRELKQLMVAQTSDKSYDTFLQILRTVRLGWLTPGKKVFRLMLSGRVAPSTILKKPASLQRKWFSELDEIEKGRWLLNFANRARNENIRVLGQILGLTPRRLQQLLRLTKSASLEKNCLAE